MIALRCYGFIYFYSYLGKEVLFCLERGWGYFVKGREAKGIVDSCCVRFL